jgi:O-acetylserine/cysteine efflux transporter
MRAASTLSPRHLLLAVAVVAIWGTNFVVIKLALAHIPPLLFAALRFALAAFPAVLFLPRPAVRWRNLAAYGVLLGVGQFGLLYLAVDGHISPGLASLVVQTQVFFTIGLAMRIDGESLKPFQYLALALAVSGIAIIALHTDRATSPLGIVLVLGAALGWAGANTVGRRVSGVNMLAYVVWSALFAVPPLLVLSFAIEGGPAMWHGVRDADLGAWAAVLWQSVANTLFGFAVWTWLLARYPAAAVTPTALLVPVFGLGASEWMLGEPLPAWKIAAVLLVLGGLALNLWWPRWRRPLAGR